MRHCHLAESNTLLHLQIILEAFLEPLDWAVERSSGKALLKERRPERYNVGAHGGAPLQNPTWCGGRCARIYGCRGAPSPASYVVRGAVRPY